VQLAINVANSHSARTEVSQILTARMSTNMSILIVAFLAGSALAVSDTSYNQLTSKAAARAMEKVFSRSARAHSMSMATITKSMSANQALKVLEKNNLTTPALLEVTSHLHSVKSHLRATTTAAPGKGYSGVEGARRLLNDMIYESMSKYDAEILKCTDYYSQQCAAMEMARGEIAASNYVAANSRELILDSQDTINKCEVDIPNTEYELKLHNTKCNTELAKMRATLKIIEGDIAVVTAILKMTDCDKKSFVELSLRRCQDACTKKSFITFNHDSLKKEVSQLQSSVSQKLMQDSFSDLFTGIESLESEEFLQLDAHQAPVTTVTKFQNPDVPRTEVPMNPCDDAYGGAPSPNHKNAAKCTIGKSPQCYKLQERFLLIQSGIEDSKNALQEDIASMEAHKKETAATLQTEIRNDQAMLGEAQTKLATATTKEANAGEQARQTAAHNSQLDKDLKKQMTTCSANYINFETEICALKKIRGEVYKMKGGVSANKTFIDCEVSPQWDPEDCSKECKRSGEAEGAQKLVRNVMTHPDGGTKCLPLAAERKCNLQPCPIDCKLSTWSGWSKCSAECGGGVRQRLREVKQAMHHNGAPCEMTSETETCNGQACEKDCELSEWSKWSWCSKDCNGGTRKRMKHIADAPKGIGECPTAKSKDRLEFKECNLFACLTKAAGDCSDYTFDTSMYTCGTLPTCCNGNTGLGLTTATVQCLPSSWASDAQYKVKCGVKPKQCKKELDIVFLLDGSGSLGETGWKAEIKTAEIFVDAFSGTGSKAEMAVILYSGPRTWGGVYQCIGRNAKKVDQEKVCMLKTVTPLTSNMATVRTSISGLTWPKGSTLTSLALMRAKAELSNGRKDAKSIIVIITDGRPLSYRNTYYASRNARKSARLVWVAVTRYAPLRYIKRWATQRWQENVVVVRQFADLEKPDVVNKVVANICPKV